MARTATGLRVSISWLDNGRHSSYLSIHTCNHLPAENASVWGIRVQPISQSAFDWQLIIDGYTGVEEDSRIATAATASGQLASSRVGFDVVYAKSIDHLSAMAIAANEPSVRGPEHGQRMARTTDDDAASDLVPANNLCMALCRMISCWFDSTLSDRHRLPVRLVSSKSSTANQWSVSEV